MPIKPLETKSNPLIFLKGLFLVTLVTTGILLNQVFLKKSKEIPSILGKTQELEQQTQKKIVKKVQESGLVKESLQQAKDVGGVVLGEMSSQLNKLTSDAGSLISEIVYENSIGKIVGQVDKLPKDQQEKIREQICK